MILTLYVADVTKNKMMSDFDLCPSHKVFVTPIKQKIERQGIGSDTSFINRIIHMSKGREDYWIPAVEHNGCLYAADGVREISDGNKIIFLPEVTA